jgi:hypothetical protein
MSHHNVFRPGVQHPDEFRADLNPEAFTGPNPGLPGPHPEKDTLTAYDLKDVHHRLSDFRDDELKAIPVLPTGSPLRQGATYIDVRDENRRPFTATADMVARPANRYVPKSDVDYVLWNRLIGVHNPERLDQAGTE